MSSLPRIALSDYQYDLTEDRIARYPLADREQSKLLVWNSGNIQHSVFEQIADYLPVNSLLFFNNTKVIPARLLFEKETGASVEVFLLGPADPGTEMVHALQVKGAASWQCTIGNAKRWPDDLVLVREIGTLRLEARWGDRAMGLISFSWTPSETPFAEVIDLVGAVPLPPYLNRHAETIDRERYQTVYSKHEGAVAAPTAGLHFTPSILSRLGSQGMQTDYLTLHVSAGTFLPIKSENAEEHRMHEEEIVVHKGNIINLLQPDKQVIAVGTTALRTLESLYWYGVMLTVNPNASFNISQDLPYQGLIHQVTSRKALEKVLQKMDDLGVDSMTGHTSIYIVPGYKFRITQGLITNFHQPGSTLLLLISAFIGPAWRAVYESAKGSGYRFLSYGDSSLLLPVKY